MESPEGLASHLDGPRAGEVRAAEGRNSWGSSGLSLSTVSPHGLFSVVASGTPDFFRGGSGLQRMGRQREREAEPGISDGTLYDPDLEVMQL